MRNVFNKYLYVFILLAATAIVILSEKTIFNLGYSTSNVYSPELLKKILIRSQNDILKSLFSPDDPVKDILIGLINSETKSIKVAIYTLTHEEIAKALLDAYKNGIKVDIVCDRYFLIDRFSKIPLLTNDKIPVWIFQASENTSFSGLMHNKFLIFESNIDNRSIVWTGSFNFTNRASTSNQENVIITDDNEIFNNYNRQFYTLKQRSMLINGKIAQIKIDDTTKNNDSWLDYALSFVTCK